MRRVKAPLFWSLFAFLGCIVYFGPRNVQYQEGSSSRIAIVVVITNISSINDYQRPLVSLECYAKVQGYDYLLLDDADYAHLCAPNDKFFTRHCVISHILPNYDYILFLDADHGVVNPKIRIEEFIDPRFDITFYDRFYAWEVSSGSYLVKNSDFTIRFLQDWANFGKNASQVKSGSDNSALHLILGEYLFSNAPDQVELCREAYNNAKNDPEVFAATACYRHYFGSRSEFGRIRVLKKGTGWSRDDWLTSGIWSSQRDFMLHGWKTKNLQPVPEGEILEPVPMNTTYFYDPLAGPIDLQKCHPGNSTWSYNQKLIGDCQLIEDKLLEYSRAVERKKMKAMSRMKTLLHDNL